MKNLIFVLLLGVLITFGCSNNNSITNPVVGQKNQKSWIKLPPTAGLKTETQYTEGAWITANKGGNVQLNKVVNIEPFGQLNMVAKLTVPPDAFHGVDSLYFTVILDDETCTATFTPSPYVFDEPLEFDLTYNGVDLTGVDPDSVGFAYLAEDGEIVNADYDQLTVHVDQGKISVKNAVLHHFSRYGFVR